MSQLLFELIDTEVMSAVLENWNFKLNFLASKMLQGYDFDLSGILTESN